MLNYMNWKQARLACNEKVRYLGKVKLAEFFLWIILALGIALIIYILSSSFLIRPYSDDVHFASRDDIFESATYWYNWSGRLTSLTIYIVAGALNLPLLWLVPFVSFGLICSGSYYLLKQYLVHVKIAFQYHKLLLLCVSVYVPIVSFFVMPYAYSAMFWFAAAPLHAWAYGLLLFFCGYIIKIACSARENVTSLRRSGEVAAVLIFSMMGEYSTFLALIVFALTFFSRRHQLTHMTKRLWHIGGGLILGLIALVASPGVLNRNQALSGTEKLGIIEALVATVNRFWEFSVMLVPHGFLIGIVFLSGLLVALMWLKNNPRASVPKKLILGTGLVLVAAFAVILSDIFLPLYAYRSEELLLNRALLPSVLAIIMSSLATGFLIGRILITIPRLTGNKQFLSGFIMGVILMTSLYVAPYYARQAREFRAFYSHRAELYDMREEYILKYAQSDAPCKLYIPGAPLNGSQEPSDVAEEADGWQNIALQRYLHSPCALIREEK